MKSVHYKSVFSKLILFFIFFIYITILMVLPDYWFNDRDFYYIYAEGSLDYLSSDRDYKFYVNEPLFHYFSYFFNRIPDYFSKVMSVFVASVFFWILYLKSSNQLSFLFGFILLIFSPYIAYAQLMTLRQGVATAFFVLIFYFVRNRKYSALLCCLLPFFHIVYFLITPVYLSYIYFFYNKSKRVIVIAYSAFFILISLFSLFFAKMIGFRQAEQYSDYSVSLGGGTFLLFLLLAIYVYFLLDCKKTNKKEYDWALISLIVYVSCYFFFPSIHRLFLSFYPFILFYLVSINTYRGVMVLFILCLVFIYLWFYSTVFIFLAVSLNTVYEDVPKLINNIL